MPCQEDERIHGESALRPFRDGTRILKMFVAERLRHGRRIDDEQPADERAQREPSLQLVGESA